MQVGALSLSGLVRAIAGPQFGVSLNVHTLITNAELNEFDLFRHLSRKLGLGLDVIYERAAHYCRLPFSLHIPFTEASAPIPARIEMFGQLHSIRSTIFDREIVFAAPDALAMLTLARHRAMDLKTFRDICIVPPGELRQHLAALHENALMDNARQKIVRRWPNASAHLDLPLRLRAGFVGVVMGMTALTLLLPPGLDLISALVLLILFIPAAWLRLTAIIELAKPPDDQEAGQSPPARLLGNDELPVYSVLIPLRNEAMMVPQLARAMRALDYPAEKLDVKFIVEAHSTATISAVTRLLTDPRFELIKVPDTSPRTKPKALNYALPFIRGAHVVVFDAEDIPQPGQLRLAASVFAEHPDIDCLQAELHIDNGGENWLTGLFKSEYSALFGVLLPSFARWGVPIPLGGTSNHFRVARLHSAGGWDAFNVTEDADLGLRFARAGMKIVTLNSRTFEEAPKHINAWLAQRTRWHKGWMQTFLVHNRRSAELREDLGWRNYMISQLYMISIILSPPLHLAFVISLLIKSAAGIPILYPGETYSYFHVFVFVSGYFSALLSSVVGASRHGMKNLGRLHLFLPVYWTLNGIASYRAMYELWRRPYHWSKTRHGFSGQRETLVAMDRAEAERPARSRKTAEGAI